MKKNLLDYNNFYLVGLKGVAMTSIAQCLRDAGKVVAGSDLAEDFVTKELLDDLNCEVEGGFEKKINDEFDCVIYTSAHKGIDNFQVMDAVERGLAVFSQAEALGELFNMKSGLAVCGVGGKSTTSAMIAWILEKTGFNPSFSVGVGNIPGLDKTGAWRAESQFFVAEADEYVIDASAPQKNQEIVPRFSFLMPWVTVCTNLDFDHPDVYRDFEHTKSVYEQFFLQIKANGFLIINGDNQELVKLAKKVQSVRPDLTIMHYGENSQANFVLNKFESKEGESLGYFSFNNQEFVVALKIPGKFNIFNALGAIFACHCAGVKIDDAISALKDFNSTMRRFENKGLINGVKCYDDYAHHPNEVKNAIQALNEWFPNQRKVIAFQSHTFSRTKQLFSEFVDAFANADEVVMIDIFASAREGFEDSVSSDLLCEEIEKKYGVKAKNLKSLDNLVDFFENNLKEGEVFLTLGAGDIYEVYEKFVSQQNRK